ncbi:hypothetical protein LOD99_919 [Oopsacas minuta]|uniref:Uncharacterized protein n=1 Tax=Oopsacas minuta TaxID=111878 RepID=A0AAV7JZX1_9METZ|nr:hypothetical protein LOD99_919 [Oopsacas minuta]
MLKLSKLTRFDFAYNPISSQKNARISIAAKFYVHNKPVELDGSEITEKEKYKIMSNINKFGSNVQNWPNAISHVSISNVIATSWINEQTSSRDHQRSLSYSISNSLLLEDPNYEVSWSHFSSPTGGTQSPSITSSAISTPVDSLSSPTPPLRNVLTPENPLEDVFIYSDSSQSQQLLLDTDNSQGYLEPPTIISPVPLPDETATADSLDEDLDLSHTPIPPGSRTPDLDCGVITVSKCALAHALALLSVNDSEQFLDESEHTPKPATVCYTSESITAAINTINLTDQTRNVIPEESCTMQQVQLEDKIMQAINSMLDSAEVTDLHINMNNQPQESESNQLRPHDIACSINERVL